MLAIEAPSPSRRRLAESLMLRFVERTGATQRYLWTDAFAVCNLLALGHEEAALQLIARVHHVLGQHRPDDARQGWLSGLLPDEGERHPTAGGLRIGKPLPERRSDEPLDDRLEWERDGQYFHYLTKWAHALDRTARATRRPFFNQWARELMDVAARRFAHDGRLYWKMSIDLSRPLVTSMGQHDPLDGLLTCRQLGDGADGPDLRPAIARFANMIEPRALATGDPLGIGGLLFDAHRLARLDREDALLPAILTAALLGLRHFSMQPDLRLPAGQRLAFRELGLAIGLAAVPALEVPPSLRGLVDEIARFLPLRDAIEQVWLTDAHRQAHSFREHADINEVMLATSLAPAGFL